MIERVTTFKRLFELQEFFYEGCLAVAKSGDEEPRPRDVLETFREKLKGDDFALFVHSEERPLAFVALVLSKTIYGEVEVYIWMMYSLPGGSARELLTSIMEWAGVHKAKILCAATTVFGGAKERWFNRWGFTKKYEIFRRTL